MVVTENTLLYRDLTEREATLARDGGRAKLALEDVGGGALDRVGAPMAGTLLAP